MLLTLNGFVFGASYGAPKERFSKTCSLHPSDAVQGLGCSPTSILQRKNGIYIRVKTHLVSTMRLLKTPPKFDNHFARMIVRFQAQLEADGFFCSEKFRVGIPLQTERAIQPSLFLPKFSLRFLASCRKQRVLKSSRLRSAAMKAPVGLLSDRTVLRSKMERLRPDKLRE